jgi:hypothetical protein
MSLKISFAFSASCLLAALAGSFAASGAAAAGPGNDKQAAVAKHRVHHQRIVVHRDLRFPHGVRSDREHIPPNAIRMPGYTFVPGVGILDESCDLPTSSCPNEYRDVQ